MGAGALDWATNNLNEDGTEARQQQLLGLATSGQDIVTKNTEMTDSVSELYSRDPVHGSDLFQYLNQPAL